MDMGRVNSVQMYLKKLIKDEVFFYKRCTFMYTISALYQIVNLKATTQWLKDISYKTGSFL